MDRKLIISISTLSFLILFYFYDSTKQSNYKDRYINIFNFDHSQISKLIILKNNDGIEIERLDSTWKINGQDSLVIKPSSIDKFFDETLTAKINSIAASKSATDLSIYSLDSTKGVNLILIDESGSTLSNVIFGLSTDNYLSNYYRNFDSNMVYRTNKNVINFLTTSHQYWGEAPKVEVPDSTISPSSDL